MFRRLTLYGGIMKILTSVVSGILSAITAFLLLFPGIRAVENAYRYNDSNEPVMSFMSEQDASVIGTWWWNFNEISDSALCSRRLAFLKENGVNEIYFYGYYMLDEADGRKALHDFVVRANADGMCVSVIYDDPTTISLPGNTEVRTIVDKYLVYVNEYPDDRMNGIHFDVEGLEPQVFASSMISQFSYFREKGVPVAMDVACIYGDNPCELDGVSGFYNVVCANVDTMVLMSYMDTYERIKRLADAPFKAAMNSGTKIVYAVETGEYPACNGVWNEFAQEDKEYCYIELAKIYNDLKQEHPRNGYGVALHCHSTWIELGKAADNGKSIITQYPKWLVSLYWKIRKIND